MTYILCPKLENYLSFYLIKKSYRYNRYERRKVFLDNKSWKGNDFAWVMDEGSVCISEHGDGGPYAISDIDLPKNAKVGDVYEKIDGKYIYNSDITAKLKEMK